MPYRFRDARIQSGKNLAEAAEELFVSKTTLSNWESGRRVPSVEAIDSDEAPGLVAARDPESGEEFVIFDGGRHGYDNMFCDEHDPAELKNRPLKRYEIPASKLVLELGYSVDYEDEKEDFEPDEADTVELINGERMPWDQVKRDGIDYIALYYVNEKGKQVQILNAELA